MSTPSDAVRVAREREFAEGVDWSTLEYRQARETPSMRGGMRLGMWAGIVKALALIAPFAGLLAPLGGTDFGRGVESDGFAGQDLQVVAMCCFVAGALGQVWVLTDWWRTGRTRDGMWIASSVVALGASVIGLWWFSFLLTGRTFATLLPMLVITGVLGGIAFFVQRFRSLQDEGDRLRARRDAWATQMRALPADERQALLVERREIVAALVERGLVDEATAQQALALPLGDWWTLDPAHAPG